MSNRTDTVHAKPSKVWVDSIIVHLDLLNQIVSRLPANERLEVDDLNKVLQLNEDFKAKFLFMCELNGFETEKTK